MKQITDAKITFSNGFCNTKARKNHSPIEENTHIYPIQNKLQNCKKMVGRVN